MGVILMGMMMVYNREILEWDNVQFYLLYRYPSRRHAVYQVLRVNQEGPLMVLKDFSTDQASLAAEKAGMSIFQVTQPRILAENNHGLLLEHLSDQTLIHCLEKREQQGKPAQDLLRSLAALLENLYQKAPGWILGDVNFRNFLVDENNEVYFVDFEDVTKGPIFQDLGRMLAFFLTYEPSFSNWKFHEAATFLRIMIEVLGIEPPQVLEKAHLEFNAMERRRKVTLDWEATKYRLSEAIEKSRISETDFGKRNANHGRK